MPAHVFCSVWTAIGRALIEGPALRARRALPAGVGLALVAGVAIGLSFLALARTAAAAGLWPLVTARIASISLFSAVALAGSQSLRLPAPVTTIAAAGGAIDMLANALYLFATRYGSLSLVVTLSSLYPASTVVLARLVVSKRLTGRQILGVACALVAVAMIVST